MHDDACEDADRNMAKGEKAPSDSKREISQNEPSHIFLSVATCNVCDKQVNDYP